MKQEYTAWELVMTSIILVLFFISIFAMWNKMITLKRYESDSVDYSNSPSELLPVGGVSSHETSELR